MDITSEDDEEGRATAVVIRDGTRLESSKGMVSSPNVKMRSRQKVDDGIDDTTVDGKPRVDDSSQALPAKSASTKRKSANFLDEILAERAKKKKRKKRKLKEVLDREAVT
jgi:hypothetical protein